MADLGGLSSILSTAPDGSNSFWLGQLGHCSALAHSHVLPGGPSSLAVLLSQPPTWRHPALNPGRIVQEIRGGSVVWDGKMQEPQSGASGWMLSAVGQGVIGADYRAHYTSWNQNQPLDLAIGRGLRWTKGTLSSSGLWLGQAPDDASITITDFLNLLTSSGGYTWLVGRRNALNVYPFPNIATATPTRLLIATSPASRTIVEDVNALYVYYQATADDTSSGGSGAATYATVLCTVPGAAVHQECEDFLDLSGAGVISSGTAQAAGNAILSKYQRANWAQPFTVHYGELLNIGGYPVDLGCEQAGEIYKLIVTDAGYGGEVSPVPIQFIGGEVDFDDGAQLLTVTPYQAMTANLQSMMTAVSNMLTPVATS